MLTRFRASGLKKFVREDGEGAVHNLEFLSTKFSKTNTAALYRTARSLSDYSLGIDEQNLSKWKTRVEGELPVDKIKISGPMDLDERKAGQRLVEMAFCFGAGPTESAKNLATWVGRHCEQWLERNWYEPPQMLTLYYADQVLSEHMEPDTKRLVRAAAADTIWRQVAFASSAGSPRFDPIELALALCVGYSGASLPPEILNSAVTSLNDATAVSKIWSSRQDSLSAVHALHSLMRDDPRSDRLRILLEPAIERQLEWLLDSTPPGNYPWLSTEHPDRHPGAEPWFNCLVLETLIDAKARLGDRISELVSKHLRAEKPTGARAWEDVRLPAPQKDALQRAFVTPLERNEKGKSTAILFGPPGTAKTTIAEALAKKMDWPLVQLGISDFLSRGIDDVFARSAELLEQLALLDKTVVLLDEVETIFFDRGNPESEMLNKFLTSALLPRLHAIHDRGSIVLLIATNHISSFDGAASRRGRIDLVVPVGPPSEEDRVALLTKNFKFSPAIAEALAKHMPARTTIGEVLAVGDIPDFGTLSPEDLVDQWDSLAGGERLLIKEDEMEKFLEESRTRARH